MDTNTITILQVIGSAIGGGGLLKIFEKILSSNKVKELSDIIDKMRQRIDDQDKRILALEIENKNLISSEWKNVIYERSFNEGMACDNHKNCPIHAKYIELKKEYENKKEQ